MKITALAARVSSFALFSALIASTTLFVPTRDAVAQGGAVMLEEVTVTARRREESLLDTPLSIVAFNAEQLQVQGIYSVDNVGQFVPNVTLNASNRANNTRIIIRGIGGGFPDPVFAFGSGMYIDGHYIPNSLSGYMSTLDIERIEVLRGPQGTLFGKNVTGGAVNIVSAKPSEDFDSSILVRATDDGQLDLRGMLNVPFSETFFGRFSVAREEFDGYYFNQNLGIDSGSTENTSGRAALRWQPNEQWTVDLAGHIAKKRDDNLGGQCIGYGEKNDAPQWGGGTGNLERRLYTGAEADFVALCNADVAAGDFINSSDKYTFSNIDEDSISMVVEWAPESSGSWNDLSFSVRAAHRTVDYTYFADRDYVSWPVDGIGTKGDRGQWNETDSFEFLIKGEVSDNFRFTAGVNWFDETAINGEDECYDLFVASGAANNPNIAVECPNNGLHFELVPNAVGPGLWPNGPRLNAGGPGPFFNNVSVWNESLGVFFNGTWDINDQWSLDFGARYTEDKRAFTNIEFPSTGCIVTVDPNNHCSFRAIMSQGTVIDDGFFNKAEDTFDAITPMISLKRNISDGMVYALYSEGFLTGGFNTEINSNLPAVAELLSYEPEKVSNYELGYKGRLADGRVQISADIFYMDYRDQQRQQDIANPDFRFGADDPVSVTQNVASSAIYGIEFEMNSSPWEGGYLGLNIGYLKNEYDEYQFADPGRPGAVVDLSDVMIHDQTPDWTINLAIDHTITMASGATITPRANVYYESGYEWAADTGSYPLDGPESSVYQDAYAKLDARITYVPAEGDWQVALYGGNLTDERILETADTNRSVWRTRLERPRFFGLEFTAHFGRN